MFFTKKIKLSSEIKKLNKIFNENGFKLYLVGGAVRDILLKKECNDYDFATDAKPEQVMKIFKKVIPTGIAHGTVTIHIFGKEFETTTFRTESDYSDGRHPDKVEYAATIEEDLSRRDFTMNAIAVDLKTGKLVDPFGGQKDIKKKIIRTVGNPLDRFGEDGLRPIRAIRFSTQLNFTIEENTFNAITNSQIIEKVKSISVERFRDEFCKMMKSNVPSIGLKLLESTGIMDIFIPEFKICRNCIQNDIRGFHEFDVADHLFYACDGAPKNNLIVRLAAFFHDIGKPEAKTIESTADGNIIHFYNHDKISSDKAKIIMTKLKFSNNEINSVCHLINNHMFKYESKQNDSSIRRLIVKIGLENINDIIALRYADIHGMHNFPVVPLSPVDKLYNELKDRIDKINSSQSILSNKNLKINGNDLMEIGIKAGPILGKILKELFETVIDSPDMNNKETLLNLAKNLYENKYN